MPDTPNILFIITDQHRADHLGCYGNSIVKTPNIDSLAGRGVRFDRFYVANPICMPNRATLMTGRMPSLHGVRHNGVPLSVEQVTFVELLREAGYRTALIGKSHLQNMTGMPPALKFPDAQGKTPPPAHLREADRHIREGRAYENENEPNWDDPAHEVLTPFYGFDTARICTGHADQVGADYLRWLRAKGGDPDTLVGPENAIGDNRYNAPQAWRTSVPPELYPTSYVEELTTEYLERHARDADGGGAPFFAQVSFPDPHHPFTPPGHYWDMYDPDDIPLPVSFGKGDLPLIAQMRKALDDGVAQRGAQAPFAVTEEETRQIIALTYGMITMIDDAIGRILAKLAELGLADNTVVVFTADHGDYMGDHGLMLKMLMHYQGLIRVPFIVADPAASDAGARRADLAGTVDIARTLLSRAGLQPFNGMQGRDLFGADHAAPDAVLVEEDSSRFYFDAPEQWRLRSLVTDRWRLTYRHGLDWGELFDLETDPEEIDNLWGDPAHAETKAALTERLVRKMIEMQDRSPLPTYQA